ncbi:DUF1896 family protein [Chryseobacterium nematophagum]|uniref:DUF1896 family protein n=2 Tax=Chryseobacterium TaxID=59732 RepID=A0A3M7THJ0_9FLAO|nr:MULTISPECIES: DUF1896 family protein [Chryseobacterium]AZA92897.1 DUF1896 family protein [Chryseobacterium nakagawai]RNA62975.1 DUF1896 family protein [Chryseobacterium nematophagum]VEH19510.1 Domain of uncharacterised function (DUF1896) [Chryseobacterium nakagawai]
MEKDVTYYKERLQNLLSNSFPELVPNTALIEQRSQWAKIVYDGAIRSGSSIEQCEYYTDHILFEKFHFSKFETVSNIINNNFGNLMKHDELKSFSLKMLKLCAPIFDKYELSDDFAYTYDFDKLCMEITASILSWINQYEF